MRLAASSTVKSVAGAGHLGRCAPCLVLHCRPVYAVEQRVLHHLLCGEPGLLYHITGCGAGIVTTPTHHTRGISSCYIAIGGSVVEVQQRHVLCVAMSRNSEMVNTHRLVRQRLGGVHRDWRLAAARVDCCRNHHAAACTPRGRGRWAPYAILGFLSSSHAVRPLPGLGAADMTCAERRRRPCAAVLPHV